MNTPAVATPLELPDDARRILRWIGDVEPGTGRTSAALAMTFPTRVLAIGMASLINLSLVRRYKCQRGYGFEITPKGRELLSAYARAAVGPGRTDGAA